jgi:AcrR family transcriptional regulator
MARVSQEHLDARRRQILEGAARCFARDGFHRTTMQDILRETGLSAGAVYRYFPGKDAIIADLAREVIGTIRRAFEDASRATDPAPPGEVVAGALVHAARLLEYPPPLVIQVWAETVRNEDLGRLLHGFLADMVRIWTGIIEAYQRRGEVRTDLPAEDHARTLIACCQGFMVQRALGMPFAMETIRNGLSAILPIGPVPAPAGGTGGAVV